MKNTSILVGAILLLLLPTFVAQAGTLEDRLAGRILLQVEQHGEAWYINPVDSLRYYMKDGAIAYEMMRNMGLGISNLNLDLIPLVGDVHDIREESSICGTNDLANRLRGRILLQVEQLGEAWYVYPENCRRIYMRDGSAAYQIMRFLGLGITDFDLGTIRANTMNNDHLRGNAAARVTIVEYGDFQCPFCGHAYETVEAILAEYGDKVNLIYRHFPLSFHEYAFETAEASECAAEQGKFWEYHDIVFENQDKYYESGSKQIRNWASEIGLNMQEFDQCLNSGEMKNRVNEDYDRGVEDGVQGTPAFYINGTSLIGAQPYSAFKQVIDLELAN